MLTNKVRLLCLLVVEVLALLAMPVIGRYIVSPVLAGGGVTSYQVSADGVVTGSPHFGDPSGEGIALHEPAVEAVSTPTGLGYYVVASDGGVFTYGDAVFHGSLPGVVVPHAPIVSIAADTYSTGYWVLGEDGGVFAFGAGYYGNVISYMPDYVTALSIAPNSDGLPGYTITDSAENIWRCGNGGECAILNPPVRGDRPTICGQGPGDGKIGWDDVVFITAVQQEVRAEWHCWLVNVATCESGWNQFAENRSSSASGYMQFLSGWWNSGFPGDWTDPWWQARATQYLLDNGGPSHWQCKG